MKGIGVIVAAAVCMALVAGCQSETPQQTAKAPVVIDPLNPPKGYILEVKFNGDCTVDVGSDKGVAKGDWFEVVRKGDTVQYLEVMGTGPVTSYCRVAVPEMPGRPVVNDKVVLEPKGLRDVNRADSNNAK